MVEEKWQFQQTMFKGIYPDSSPIDIKAIVVPTKLARGVKEFSFVKRYDNPEHTPDRCIDDDVQRHLLRGAARVLSAPLNIARNFPDWEVRWFAHDWGEYGKTHDTQVTEKAANAAVANATDLDELEIARKNLPPGFFQYYQEVELAAKFLRGKTEEIPSGVGLVLKVVDKCDGPLVYFYNYCNWLQTHNYDGKIPPDIVFTYTLTENNKFRSNLLRVGDKIGKETLDTCLYLLYNQIKVVALLWDEVDKSKWPTVMADQLQLMQDYLVTNLA